MYIRGFNGLRAVAVLLVFLMHKTEWGEKAQFGFAGVWLFFLLSGFLITGQLSASRARVEAREASLRWEVIAFWIKRALRIFPAYYVLLALVVPFYLLSHREVSGLPFYATYLSNVFFQAEPREFLTTFAHFWSLAVEEQFYILFAPLLLLVPSRFSAHVCGLVILASLLRRFWLAQLDVSVAVVYVDSLVNFGILALGGLLYLQQAALTRALRAARLHWASAGWAALLLWLATPPFALWLAGASLPRLQCAYVVGIAAGALLLVNVYLNQRSLLTSLLEWQPIAYLGRISYGLYLYNDYVKADLPQRLVRILLERSTDPQQSLAWANRFFSYTTWGHNLLGALGLAVCFGATVGIAQISWFAVERPALRLRERCLNNRQKTPNIAPTDHPVGAHESNSVTLLVH